MHTVASMLSVVAHARIGIDAAVIAPFALRLRKDVAAMSAPVTGMLLPVRCASFSCCCYRLLCSSCPTHVPLHSFSARSGSLIRRCVSCVLVSHDCSGVLRSLPIHPIEDIERSFESQLRSVLRVVTHVLHDFLDVLAVQEFRHEVCFIACPKEFPNRRFPPVEHSLLPQTPSVHVSHPPCTQS